MSEAIAFNTLVVKPLDFAVEEDRRHMFLRCGDFGASAEACRIAVRVLSEKESQKLPLQGSPKYLCCCKPSSVVVTLSVGGTLTHLKVKVSEVVKKWGLLEARVRAACEEGDFAALVRTAISAKAANSILPHLQLHLPSETAPDPEEPWQKPAPLVVPADSDDEDYVRPPTSRKSAPSTSRSRSPNASDEEETSSGSQTPTASASWGTPRSKSHARLPETSDEKGQPPLSFDFLQQPPFRQLYTFLDGFPDERERTALFTTLAKHWRSIEKHIRINLPLWQSRSLKAASSSHQRQPTASNVFVSQSSRNPFALEYFAGDRSTMIYLNCGVRTPLALNLVSGLLYRRVVLVDIERRHVLRAISELSQTTPSIDAIRISAITTRDKQRIYRLLVPCVGLNLTKALEEGNINMQNRDACTEQWITALAALHRAHIYHKRISADALLVRPHPVDNTLVAVLGDFSHAAPVDQNALPTAKFQDIKMLGLCLQKQLYADICDAESVSARDRTIVTMIQKMTDIAHPITAEEVLKLWHS